LVKNGVCVFKGQEFTKTNWAVNVNLISGVLCLLLDTGLIGNEWVRAWVGDRRSYEFQRFCCSSVLLFVW